MNLPDRIIAIGGAGKEITLTLLQQEWVLESVLEAKPNPQSLTVTIIDTAEGEQNEDRDRIRAIRERAQELKREARESDRGHPGSIDINYKLITQNVQLNGQIDLLGENVVPRIAEGNGMDQENWWVKPDHINENLDFARGVLRKRALGKAMYYKAYAEDDEISSYIDLPDKGKVATIVGLGGGTGSGLLIDLAQSLRQRQRTAEITLFGVLPNHNEGVKVSANAYAVLSELEYLSLTGNEVFKDRILLPIDPTGFDGKRGDRIQSVEPLQEFDEAIVYLLSSYYNTQNLEDPFAGAPSFAPFTIGIPQVLRYNVESIETARGSISELLDTKRDALRAEQNIYDSIERFFARHYPEDSVGAIRDSDRADLEKRFESTKQLIEFDLFEELEYQSLEIFSSIVDDAQGETEDIEDQVDILSNSLRAVDTTGTQVNSFVDPVDEDLAEILEQELQLIKRRKDLLTKRQAVDDKRIRESIDYLIAATDSTSPPGVFLQRLETEIEELDERQSQLERDLEGARQELEDLREEQSEKIERSLGQWERAIEDTLTQLRAFEQQSIESDFESLTAQLDGFAETVANSETAGEVDQVSQADIDQTLNSIAGSLDEVGISFDGDRQDILSSLADLKQCRKAQLQLNQDEGLVDQYAPWKTSGDKQKEEALKDFRMQKSKLDDREVISVGSDTSTFTFDVRYDSGAVLSEYRSRRQQLQISIIDELRDRVENLPQDLTEELEAAVTDDVDGERLSELGREAFERNLSGTDEIESRTAELEAELDEVEAKFDLYEATTTLFQDVNTRREEYVSKQEEFHREQSQFDDRDSGSLGAGEDEYIYVKEIQPTDVLHTTGEGDIKQSDLLSNPNEADRVRESLDELASNARGEQYTGLRRRKLSRNGRRYSDQKVRVGVMSRGIDDVEPDALQFRETFEGSFDLGASANSIDSPYTSWQYDAGGNWDIGLSVFIDGVFLDNLRKVVQANGYRSGYERRHDTVGDNIMVHHALGLEDGYYVRRNEIKNMENPDDVGFFLQDEQDVVDQLLEESVEKVQHGVSSNIVSK